MADIGNLHDKFFKEIFTRREALKDFLTQALPQPIAALVDLESLEYLKDSFIDENLRERFSDLLLQVAFKDHGPGYLYLLFEHKSYREPRIALHLPRYMVKIWDACVKQDRLLPVIVPLVFHHGRDSMREGCAFADLFRVPDDLSRFLPAFDYKVGNEGCKKACNKDCNKPGKTF